MAASLIVVLASLFEIIFSNRKRMTIVVVKVEIKHECTVLLFRVLVYLSLCVFVWKTCNMRVLNRTAVQWVALTAVSAAR